jgi:hypothetical protein
MAHSFLKKNKNDIQRMRGRAFFGCPHTTCRSFAGGMWPCGESPVCALKKKMKMKPQGALFQDETPRALRGCCRLQTVQDRTGPPAQHPTRCYKSTHYKSRPPGPGARQPSAVGQPAAAVQQLRQCGVPTWSASKESGKFSHSSPLPGRASQVGPPVASFLKNARPRIPGDGQISPAGRDRLDGIPLGCRVTDHGCDLGLGGRARGRTA